MGAILLHKTVVTVMSQDTSPFVPPPPEDDVLIGAIIHYGGTTVPPKYLRADGSAVSRTTYALLFAAYGTTFGPGDGSTTFNLPEVRGRSLVGTGTGPGLSARALGASGGEEDHQLVGAELASHVHTITDPGHQHGVPLPTWTGSISTNPGANAIQLTGEIQSPLGFPTDIQPTGIVATDSDGSDTPHNTMHPWFSAYALVYAGV